MQKISAVIVTWNSSADIKQCLESIQRQTYPIAETFVVDNNSQDGTPDLIAKEFPRVILLRQTENLGFAKANNLAFDKATGEWILALNPDAWIANDFIEKLMAFNGDKHKIGALGGKILAAGISNGNIIDSAGVEIFRSRRVRDRGMGEIDAGQYSNPERVFGICAAAALYRKEMLDEVKIDGQIFPERFFAYYEDADLAWRQWRTGWESWYAPDAAAWHKRGGSPTGSRFSRALTHRNRLWLIARNESILNIMKHPAAFLVHELLMLLRIIRYPYLIEAVFEALKGLPRSIKERKQIADQNQQPPPFRKGIGFTLRTIGRAASR